MSESVDQDKIVYYETRTINVGQYENVTCGLTAHYNVKRFNKVDKVITISHLESATVEDFEKDFKNTFIMLSKNVKRALNTRERQIRLLVEDFTSGTPELLRKTPSEEDCL